jgi:hypothetical protein
MPKRDRIIGFQVSRQIFRPKLPTITRNSDHSSRSKSGADPKTFDFTATTPAL